MFARMIHSSHGVDALAQQFSTLQVARGRGLPGGSGYPNVPQTQRIQQLKEVLQAAKKNHATDILKEASLKDAHMYSVIERLSAQKFGPLIEQYIIHKFGFTKNSASTCSGDCSKNSETFEIKVSLGGATHDKFNYVQLRPSHPISYYILTAYHLCEDNISTEGELYIFKVAKEDMKTLIVNHGSYAHGTLKEHLRITEESLDDITNKKEYALRTRIGDACWKALLPFRIQENAL
jgi:hypothetical protein